MFKEISMNTSVIRQKLHHYLDVANEKKIKAIYTMLEEEIIEMDVEYSDDLKAELDSRYNAYISGSEKIYTAEESNARIKEILKSFAS